MHQKYIRHFLKNKYRKVILSKGSERLNVNLKSFLDLKTKMESVKTDFGEIFVVKGKPILVRREEKIFPTLFFKEIFTEVPKIIVDMGAVPHVCKGADIMAPGIVRFEGKFRKGDLVYILDEKYGKPIAVGEILFDSMNLEQMKNGVVVKNIHFVGDTLWNFVKNLTSTL